MAYLQDTYLDEYRLPYAEHKADLYEHRLANYGALEAFKADTSNLINASLLSEMKKAQGQTTTYPVIKTKDYTITTTRSCTKIENYNTSANVTVTFTTMRAGFHMVPSQYQYNQIGYMDDFKKKMDDMQKSMLASLDGTAYTTINAAISAVNNADGNPYPVVANTMVVPNADKEEFFNEAWAIMNQNNIFGDINVLASPRTNALIKHLGAQGVGNSTNYAYQFAGMDFKYSRNVSVATGYRDTIFLYPKGSLGFITWIDPDSRQNQQSYNVKWSTEYLPLLGFDVGLMYQDGCADNSTEVGNGYEASKYEAFTFSFDYAWVTAYNSDSTTYPGVIFKAAISQT